MPDESEILAEAPHAKKCPSCLSEKMVKDPGPSGDLVARCEVCGHVWVGQDFSQQEAEKPPIPE